MSGEHDLAQQHHVLQPEVCNRAAGLAAARARGRMGGRPRKMDRATLMMAMSAMADRKAVAAEVAKRLTSRPPPSTPTSTATGRRRRRARPCSTARIYPGAAARHDPGHRRASRRSNAKPRACDAEGRRRAGRGAFGPAPPSRGAAGAASRAQRSDGVDGAALRGQPGHAVSPVARRPPAEGRAPRRSRPSARDAGGPRSSAGARSSPP